MLTERANCRALGFDKMICRYGREGLLRPTGMTSGVPVTGSGMMRQSMSRLPSLARTVFGIDCRIIPDPVTGTPLVIPVGRSKPSLPIATDHFVEPLTRDSWRVLQHHLRIIQPETGLF